MLEDAEITAGEDSEGGVFMNKKTEQVLSRRGFLKLGLASISATVLLFVSGCAGGEDDDDGGDDDDDDSSRRRRRRR